MVSTVSAPALSVLKVALSLMPVDVCCGLNHSLALLRGETGEKEVQGCGCGRGGRLPGWSQGSPVFVRLSVKVCINTPAYLSTCVPVHLCTCTLVYLPAYLCTCTPVYLHSSLPAYLYTCLPVYLHTSTSTPVHPYPCARAHLCTGTPFYQCTRLPAPLSTCTPVYLCTCTPVYLCFCMTVYLFTSIPGVSITKQDRCVKPESLQNVEHGLK